MAAALVFAAPAQASLPQQSGFVDLGSPANVAMIGAAGDHAGSTVAAGDVNADGFGDVVVGSPLADLPARVDAGRVDIVFGSPTPAGVDLSADGAGVVHIDGAATGDGADGMSVALGDVNADRRPDVIIGFPGATRNGRAGAGTVYVLYGSSAPVDVDLAALGSAGYRIDGAAAGDRAGASVASAGDVNGDGIGDVVVGSPGAGANSRPNSGSAFVVFGRRTGGDVDLAGLSSGGIRIDGAVNFEQTGHAVAGAGDMNGDGMADVVLGAPLAGAGSAYVVFGTAGGALDLAALGAGGFTIRGRAFDLAGVAVAGTRLDGFAAVAIGAAGSHSLYVIPPQPPSSTVDLGAPPDAVRQLDGPPYSGFGAAVAPAVGIKHDGVPDLVIGAPNAFDYAGWVHVRTGPTFYDWAFDAGGSRDHDEAGTAVAATDVNGDGTSDVIVGAPSAYADVRVNAGAAYVVFGYRTPDVAYPPMLEASVGIPIAPLAPTVRHTGPARFALASPLPPGLVLDPTTGVISGTPTAVVAPARYRVTMTDLAGSRSASLLIIVRGSTAPPPPWAHATTSLRVVGLRVSPRTFAVGSGGAVISYALWRPASVRVSIAHKVTGRRLGERCVAPRRALRHRATCTRWVSIGVLRRPLAAAGRQAFRFSGRIAGRALTPGSYRATIVATDASGNAGQPKTASFTIVRPRKR
jgi:hypothetical protein